MIAGGKLFWPLLLLSSASFAQITDEFYGTSHPFVSEAIYFVLTDRFADGDTGNNHAQQGQQHGTWQRRLDGPGGQAAFVGYMGGDFKGIYDNADYISDMGFTAVWITPIVDNPDQAFTGGNRVQFGSGIGADRGKTGYHGYWGVNFFEVDEHLGSPGFSFQEFTRKMQDDHGLKIVADIVGNHGSPSFEMTFDQPKFGEIYDESGNLVADHQNLPPEQLDANNPLHAFFNHSRDIGQLSDFDPDHPAVVDYIVDSSLQLIDQGAAAFRIDTIKHQPHRFWKQFSDAIRARHPGFFMFGESFSSDAGFIAQHQRPENGGISVLDFPGKDSMRAVFGRADSDYGQIEGYLHLTDCVYTNSYELATFYDNHDVPRMDASENGFIDAHNWLFTTRGLPVVYYGSEMRFMHGKPEHQGNRNFYGPGNIAAARNSEIFRRLARIANIRKQSPALQRGLQENVFFDGHKAGFYRVYQKDGVHQTALVLLNKGDQASQFTVDKFVSAGSWRDAHTGEVLTVSSGDRRIATAVGPHDVKVLLFDEPVNHPEFVTQLRWTQMALELCSLPRVTVTPDPLMAGEPVTVHYRAPANQQIALHWGINNWGGTSTPVSEDPMTFDQDTLGHAITLTIPAEATQFDFVFHNLTDDTWDNNNGQDFHHQVVSRVPPTPRNLSVTTENRSVTLQWQPVLNAASYALYFTDDGSDPTAASRKLTMDTTHFAHMDLSNGVSYRYRVAAANAHGESALSEVVTAVPGRSFRSRLERGSVLRLTGEAFADWVPDNDEFVLQMVEDFTWTGTVEVPSALAQTPYKLTLNGAWTVNWGGGASGRDAQLARGGGNATVSLGPGIYTLRVTEGSSVNSAVQVSWIGAGDPVLGVEPGSKQLVLAKGASETFNIRLSNTGGGELVIAGVSADVSWLEAAFNTAESVVEATADTAGLPIGDQATGRITVRSNGGDRAINVELTITQPTEAATVAFTCENGRTYVGQSVYVVGSSLELGTWALENAIRLQPKSYPTWTGEIELPADADVEWKCVKREEVNPRAGVSWQPGENNRLCTRSSCPREVSARF